MPQYDVEYADGSTETITVPENLEELLIAERAWHDDLFAKFYPNIEETMRMP